MKFVGAVMSLGAGLALGREGPSVQMGGSVGAMWAGLSRRPEGAHALMAAGAAAGLAAAFNAPLSGAVFILEEMRPQFRFGFVSFHAVLVASVVADVVTRSFIGQAPMLDTSQFGTPALASLPLFMAFGLLIGVVGVFFSRTLLMLVDRVKVLGEWPAVWLSPERWARASRA